MNAFSTSPMTSSALEIIASFVAKDESATFSLDLHPEGAYRAKMTANTFTVFAVRITAEGAIGALADELTARFGTL